MIMQSKKVLALVLSAVLAFNSWNLPMHASEEQNETYFGEPITTQIFTDMFTERENDFNKDWKFYFGTSDTAQNQNFDDSSWEDVDLPHDFSISQDFTISGEAESGFLPGGTGWYRKSFIAPKSIEGKNIVLNFDGVYSDAYVYVNGTYVGEHHYGYTNFAFDITEYLHCDGETENVIAVKAVNNIPTSRWYSGSGIYRDVTLLVTDPVHVDLNGTQITTPLISEEYGTVNINAEIINTNDEDAVVTVVNTITKKGETEILALTEPESVTVTGNNTATVEVDVKVLEPQLWSIETPNLYEVHTIITADNEEIDRYDTTFGFRWFSFDNTGFHLNGKNVKLNGVCMHHDQGALGSAAYDDAIYRQMSIMKDMGVNAVRVTHNPADEDLIEICNELGLLVIEEAFDGWVDAKNENSNDFSVYFEKTLGDGNSLYAGNSDMTYAEYAVRSFVKRDRNAPSIIAWSLCNEVQEGTYWTQVNRYADIAKELIGWIKSLDSTRPTTSGDNDRGGSEALVNVIKTITENGGIAGFNYAKSLNVLQTLATNYGGDTGAIIASETSSAINSRGIYKSQNSADDADGKYHLTSYDTSCVTWGMTAHDSIYNTYQDDRVAGEFVWTGFDYIGEPTPWNGTGAGSVTGSGAIPNSSYFGIVETTGFEKDTYYLYRSQWNKEETTLHLVTAWDSDNYILSNNKTPVWVYSNAPKVKLYRNGKEVGTATRVEHTSSAGHTYYTYTTESSDSSICTTSSGNGSEGLYAVFDVTYEAGTLSAKAFDESGNEITLEGNSGNHTVTTPGTVSKLEVSQSTETVLADGYSLTYIEVDVTDKDGNLDTIATNNIKFSLEGNGKIVGVDNGDQATTKKYQQSSVLESTTSANIDAYAGKALAIICSTEDAGDIKVKVTSTGLEGKEIKITSTASKNDMAKEGMVSYTMIKDYSIMEGTVPQLENSATGQLATGREVTGTITWDSIEESFYNTAGDYVIKGKLSFDGVEEITVSAKLHVIANVIAMQNISTATTESIVPTLPSSVKGVMADGTVTGEFQVQWEDISPEDLEEVGSVLTVKGNANVIGEKTMPVTCAVRVAEEISAESTNIAPQCNSLEQDIASNKQSDNLESIINATQKPGDNTSERWTNWGNRTTSDTATLTLTWATAHSISDVNIYYYYDSCCEKPEEITFAYSLNGQEYTKIEVEAAQMGENYYLGACYKYTFAEVINPIGLKITFTQQDGTTGNYCVGVTELEVMTYAATFEYYTGAELSKIIVDEKELEGFVVSTFKYEANGSVVSAETEVNAGITILPVYENIVRILTISEDGKENHVYEITVKEKQQCTHDVTEVKDQKEATCTEDGYTGDTVCIKCGETLVEGSVISAKGHSYNVGVITEEPTTEKTGVITYTCTECGNTKTGVIPKLEKEEPSVSLKAEKGESSNMIKLTGSVWDYDNLKKYKEITGHGIIYCLASRVGTRTLTVNTSGRTKVNFTGYKEDGSYVYNLRATNSTTKYVVRAFITYKDEDGKTKYVYSDQIKVSYSTLN